MGFMEQYLKDLYAKGGLDYDETERNRDVSTDLYTCPNCGYAVRSASNAEPKCRSCGVRVIVRNGIVKGWN